MSNYTVEIQVGNAEGTIWQAMEPAENVTDTCLSDLGSARQVAYDVLNNQNILALDDGGPWRICVWAGHDADTGTEPTYILDDEQFHDAQADALDRWEDARVDG